jgi:PAS domain S-box-containing protein
MMAPALGLRAHLVALILAVLLPSLALGAATAWHMAGNYRAASEERLSATVGAMALAVDRELEARSAALGVLAASPLLDKPDGDLGAFGTQARRVAEAIGSLIVLIGPDLHIRTHTGRPLGMPLPAINAAETARVALATGRPVVSDLITGSVSGTPLAAVVIPVQRDGRSVALLATPLGAPRLLTLLATPGVLSGDAFATLSDSRNIVVARSRASQEFMGRPVPDWFTQASAGRDAGIVEGTALEGQAVILAFRRLASAPGWTVTIALPLAAHRASWQRPLLALAAGGTATFLAALAAAAWLGRRILRPVRVLTRQAEAVAASGGDAHVGGDEPAGIAEFERLRLSMQRADTVLRDRAAEIAAGEARLRAVVETAADAIVVMSETGIIQSFNRAAESIFGYAEAEVIGRNLSSLMPTEHAEQHDGYLATYRRTGEKRMIGVRREVEGRRRDGALVPLDLAIAEWRDAGGRRFFTGIMRDISARKADEVRRTLLAREVDHRAKNALAVVQSVIRLTPRDQPENFATSVEARVAALARVHSLLATGGWSGADLRTVAERELAPYTPMARGRGAAVSLDGPPVVLAPIAVQPLAMVLHELATNAAKHGALSTPDGRVEVRWRAGRRAGEDGLLRLRWAESGGPEVRGAPARRGFGIRVIETTIRGQLGGSVEPRWEPTGHVVETAIPLSRAVGAAAAASVVAG